MLAMAVPHVWQAIPGACLTSTLCLPDQYDILGRPVLYAWKAGTTCLEEQYRSETSKNVYPEKVSDLVAWKLMLRLLRT